jgi:diguanylate cyclase (GGDEF)-like protein
MQKKSFETESHFTPPWVRGWIEWLIRRPKSLLWLRAFFLLAAGAELDIITGQQVSIFAFYFVPLFIAAFLIGAPAGVAMAFMASVVRLYANFLFPHYMWGQPLGSLLIPIWNFLIDFVSFLIFAFLFAILREQLDRENQLARRDPLTRALNLRGLTEAANAEIARTRRHNIPFTLFYLDLDNFKRVNDTEGHEAGDELLRVVVNTLQQSVRSLDVVARLGGDEFGVLLPHTGAEGACIALERIQTALLDAMQAHEWPVTFSIGGLTFESAPESLESALREADQLMYRAKREGKNRYYHQIHDPYMVDSRVLLPQPIGALDVQAV